MMNLKLTFVFLISCFTVFETYSQSEIYTNVERMFEAQNYEGITSYFCSARIMDEQRDGKINYYLGVSLYEQGHLIYPYIYLSNIKDKSILKGKEKKKVKSILRELGIKSHQAYSLFIEGYNLYQNNKNNLAIAKLESVLKVDPKFYTAAYYLFELGVRIKDDNMVDKYYTIYHNQCASNLILYNNAGVYFRKDGVDKVKAVIKPLKELECGTYAILLRDAYYEEKRYDEAIYLKNICENKGGISDLMNAELLFAEGNYQEALNYLIPVFEEEPMESVVEKICLALIQQEQYALCDEYLEKWIAINEASAQAYYLKGKLVLETMEGYYYRNETNKKALPHLKKATELDPEEPYYWYELASVYRAIDLREEGIEAINKAIALSPLKYYFYELKWRMYINTNNLRAERAVGEEAIKAFKPAFEKDSLNEDFAYALGMAYKMSAIGLYKTPAIQREKIAVQYLMMAAKLNPEELTYLEELDYIYKFGKLSGNDTEKLELYEFMIANYPDKIIGYEKMFWYFYWDSNFSRANYFYKKMIAIDPWDQSLDEIYDAVYRAKDATQWATLPIVHYKNISNKYTDTIAKTLSNKYWVNRIKGCESPTDKFVFNDDLTQVTVYYSSPIRFNGEVVDSVVYDVLGSYPNGLRLRIVNEYRKNANGNIQVWDLILFDENTFRWRAYPTNSPYKFHGYNVVCED